MSETVIVANSSETKTVPAMGKFERYLTLWVVLCIIVGIGLGQLMPSLFHVARRGNCGRSESAGRGARLADDRSHAAQNRPRRSWAGTRALAWHHRDGWN